MNSRLGETWRKPWISSKGFGLGKDHWQMNHHVRQRRKKCPTTCKILVLKQTRVARKAKLRWRTVASSSTAEADFLAGSSGVSAAEAGHVAT